MVGDLPQSQVIKRFMSWKSFGAVLPSLLTLIFIVRFGVNVIVWDEIDLIPLVKAFFEGGPWLSYLILPHNEHLIVLPSLVILANAALTSWNVVWEMLTGWFLINVSLVVLWRLVKETVPGSTWLIVPVSWLLFLFEQSGNYVSGFSPLPWYMTTSFFLLSIYFLWRLPRHWVQFLVALLFAYLASFSSLLGLIVWPVGLGSFLRLSGGRKIIFLCGWVVAGGVAILTYLKLWIPGGYSGSLTLDPVSVLEFVFAYLGAGLGAWTPTINEVMALNFHNLFIHGFSYYSINSEYGSLVVGILYSLAFVGAIYTVRRGLSLLTPWLQMAAFAVISAVVTAFGRFGFAGLGYAVSSRYVAVSVLFLIPGFVIIMRSFAMNSRTSTGLRYSPIAFLSLFVLSLFLGYVDGFERGASLHFDMLMSLSCLHHLNDPAYRACLEAGGYPDYNILLQRVAALNKLCLGAMASCSNFSALRVVIFLSAVAVISLLCWRLAKRPNHSK
jgi:hypothetical protein